MTVYLVIIEDRHIDVEVEVWADGTKAIQRGKEIALEYAGDPKNVKEYLTPSMIKSGWLYNATYSCEDDCVRVQKTVIRL
jgi:hypothetical protein